MAASTGARDCPCHSGRRYHACCKPLHAGEACAATPASLMRSRYAAFALGLGPYLVETLAAHHPDRLEPRDVLVRELSRAHLSQRFMGLTIFESTIGGRNSDEDRDDPRRGEVLFHARIFAQGRDVSFVELSSFVREDEGWRYAAGELLPAKALGMPLEGLGRATFLARAQLAPKT